MYNLLVFSGLRENKSPSQHHYHSFTGFWNCRYFPPFALCITYLFSVGCERTSPPLSTTTIVLPVSGMGFTAATVRITSTEPPDSSSRRLTLRPAAARPVTLLHAE